MRKHDPAALARQTPPYRVQTARLSDPYVTVQTFTSFGRAFIFYALTPVSPGYKKRLLNGKKNVVTRQLHG